MCDEPLLLFHWVVVIIGVIVGVGVILNYPYIITVIHSKSGKDDLVKFIHETSHQLLAHYALLQGGEVGEVVWRGIEDTRWWRTQVGSAGDCLFV